MRKKGIGFTDPVFMMLLAVTFLLVFWLGNSWLQQLKESQSELIAGSIPGEQVDYKEQVFKITEQQKTSFDDLMAKMKGKYTIPPEGCFLKFDEKGLYDLDDSKLIITKTGNDILFRFENKDGSPILSDTIKDREPCVVLGNNEKGRSISELFYMKFIYPIIKEKYTISAPDKYVTHNSNLFATHKEIDISEYRGISIFERENKAAMLKVDGISTGRDIEFPILYAADEKHICFIPTGGSNDLYCDGKNYLDRHCFKRSDVLADINSKLCKEKKTLSFEEKKKIINRNIDRLNTQINRLSDYRLDILCKVSIPIDLANSDGKIKIYDGKISTYIADKLLATEAITVKNIFRNIKYDYLKAATSVYENNKELFLTSEDTVIYLVTSKGTWGWSKEYQFIDNVNQCQNKKTVAGVTG